MDDVTDQGPHGYVFGVGDTAFCCWEYDLIERNVRFLTGLDAEYFGRLAEILSEHLGGDGGGTASIALRAAYHQGVETLFSMLGAYAQAPECVPGWLACCKSEDLRKIVEGLRRGSPLLTQVGRRIVRLDDLAEDILRNVWVDEVGPESTRSRFTRFWRRLAGELLDETARAEYNSIKHGLRVNPGGFYMAVGHEETPGVPAPPEAMRSMGGSPYGSSFFEIERLGEGKRSPHIRARSVSVNWSAQGLLGRLALISMSITNIVGALQCAMGADPASIKFVRPERAEAFDDVWIPVGVTSSRIDTIVRIETTQERSSNQLRADLEERGRGDRVDG
jgi:hypothetical protein